MLKKIAFASLCLTIISIVVFGKAYTQMRQQANDQYQHEQAIETTLGRVDQVVSGQLDIKELTKHSQIAAARQTAAPADNKSSVVAAVSAITAVIFAAIFLIWPIKIIIRLAMNLFAKLTAWIKSIGDEHEQPLAATVPVETCVSEIKVSPQLSLTEDLPDEIEIVQAQDSDVSYSPVAEMLMSSGSFLHHPKESNKLAMLYTDEEPEDMDIDISIASTATAVLDEPHEALSPSVSENIQEAISTPISNSKLQIPTMSIPKLSMEPVAELTAAKVKTENKSLWAKTENLEKQVSEFKEMAHSVQSSQDSNAPVKQALDQLMHQVSAIREYASNQQDRVKKLQDGYDWTIIRSFCLRVIRCLDNIETRIEKMQEEEQETCSLEETRDDFIFALESSGVEQFEPELNSEYRGQEKYIEAIKDRVPCEDPSQAGRIAKVVRRGYQYVIDDDNLKVVRTAQVKLFANQ